jgi:hypothetical protein
LDVSRKICKSKTRSPSYYSHKRITKAQDELKWLRIDGRLAVRSTAARLADIVSGDWLRYHFPGKAPSRTTRFVPRSTRDPDLERRNWEKHSNHHFIRTRAPETLQALLRDLESVLASALTSIESDPRARGGRQPLAYRHNVIVNLATIWSLMGKTLSGMLSQVLTLSVMTFSRPGDGEPTD